MRLVLIGPCDGQVEALARAARSALVTLGGGRVVYLGTDGALDAVVAGWADLLGVRAPIAERVHELLDAEPARLFDEVDRERARARLAALRSIAVPGARTIEILHDRIVLLVDDKTDLDEEDLLPASFIVFGRGEPTIRRVGSRVFLCPGSPARRTGTSGEGILVLDEGASSSAVAVSLHDVDGRLVQRELHETSRSAKLKVQGASS